jgi:hypothetical protein
VSTWKVILATLVIFGAGVITGGLLVKQVTKPPSAPQPFLRAEMLFRMTRSLDLTPDQRGRIENILRASQERTRILFDLLRPEFNEETRKVNELIRAELTPAQRGEFERLLTQQPRRPAEPPMSKQWRGRQPGTGEFAPDEPMPPEGGRRPQPPNRPRFDGPPQDGPRRPPQQQPGTPPPDQP